MATKKITITLPTELIKRLKLSAKEEGRSLSNLIARRLGLASADETAKFIE